MKLRGKQAYENKRNEKGETRRKIFSLFFGLILFGDFNVFDICMFILSKKKKKNKELKQHKMIQHRFSENLIPNSGCSIEILLVHMKHPWTFTRQ